MENEGQEFTPLLCTRCKRTIDEGDEAVQVIKGNFNPELGEVEPDEWLATFHVECFDTERQLS
jgi:hypothetical protein